jgi:pimeloyl-ACP methyl ester carboxylesterase
MEYERDSAGLVADTLNIDGRKVAYLHNETPREGADLVMLHGFAANKENWLRMAGELSDRFNIYAIDLPGHGESNSGLDRPYGINDQVGYLQEILATLELDPVHLMGNSMGAAIAAAYAAQKPQQISTLTLMNSAGVYAYETEVGASIRQGSNPLIVRKPGDFEKLIDIVLEDAPFVPWPIYSVMEEKAIARQAVNEKIFNDTVPDYGETFRDNLGNITAPTLIIWGRQDRLIDYRNAAIFESRIPMARTVILDGIGHAPMVEAPEKTADLVENLINGPALAESGPSGTAL